MSERVLRVGLLGCGNVGASVIRLLHDRADDIALRADCRLRVTRVAVRDPERTREVPIDPSVFTTDAVAIVDDTRARSCSTPLLRRTPTSTSRRRWPEGSRSSVR